MTAETPEAANTGLKLAIHREGDETVIECAGRLTLENADALKNEGKAAIPGANRVVVDLKGVTRMDSAGLGAVVGLYVSARKAKCEFLLVNYSKSIRDLLGMTHLLSVFETCAQTGMRFP